MPLGWRDEFVVEQYISHGSYFPTGTSGPIVELLFLRKVQAFPIFRDIIHHRNGRPPQLIAQTEITSEGLATAQPVDLIRKLPSSLSRIQIFE